jgi:hypothetical protein
MSHTSQVICPNCGTVLKADDRVRVGKRVTCPRCSTEFKARADGDAPLPIGRAVSSASVPLGVPRKGINVGRLAVVLLGAVIYLLGGGALAVYCFTRSAPAPEEHASTPSTASDPNDDATSPVPAPPVSRPTVALDAAEQRKVNEAIARGVWYLKDAQLDSGSWNDTTYGMGQAALPGLALLECGVPGGDPVIQKTAAYVRKQVPNFPNTYERVLALLFLDRLGETKDEPLIQYLAVCILAGQLPDGGWTYPCPAPEQSKTAELLEKLRDAKMTLDQWQQAVVNNQPFNAGAVADNSNTQFAILAVWVAGRHKVPIARTVAQIEKRFRGSQAADGNWGYNNGAVGTASMTCAGLLGLAVALGVSDQGKASSKKPLEDDAVRKGLAALAKQINAQGGAPPFDLYLLWSLERVGVIYNLPKIDDLDWYAWGRNPVLSKQQQNGSWVYNDPTYTPVGTAFALLFLKQANVAPDLTTKLQLLAEKK